MLFNVDLNILIFIFFCRYIPVWDIIDARRELQLHRPLHAFAFFLILVIVILLIIDSTATLNMEYMTV